MPWQAPKKNDGRVDHFRNLNWRRTFLSKTRYMGGRQCSKRLLQTVYDPEPAEEPLTGTVMGMGTEGGIKARLLWPGGVLVDTKHQAEAISRRRWFESYTWYPVRRAASGSFLGGFGRPALRARADGHDGRHPKPFTEAVASYQPPKFERRCPGARYRGAARRRAS
jgi:hypothetical protein